MGKLKKKAGTGTMVAILIAILVVAHSAVIVAGEPGSGWRFPLRLTGLFSKSTVDVKSYECDACGQIHGPDVQCIERVPVQECVTGKKKVYDCKIRYEYVSVPEVRYRWKNKWVTKEIPAEYCKPVCTTQDGKHCFGEERWSKNDLGCTKEHCKTIEPKHEKAQCKYCGFEPGETTIKVRYKTCVKIPYTVYRQVKRPVCVKQPRYEKVEVPITRHKCKRGDCRGCDHCDQSGCDACAR